MKTLIADKFSEAHLDRLNQLGCQVTYQPSLKAEELPNLYGTHHIGASTEQAQEAVAQEALRIIETFVKTGVVLNCVQERER